MSPQGVLRSLIDTFDLKSTGKWFVVASAVGLIAGLGAFVFQFLCQLVLVYALHDVAGYEAAEPVGEHLWLTSSPGEFSPWLLIAVMVAGGLVSGWLVYTFAPEAEGHGTDAAIEAFHQKRGVIAARIPFIKMIASAATIGTGGSAGREGPIAQIGAGFGSFLATRLRWSARDRRILLAAGMGAGVGAVFRAPLAGALFAGEILYRDADLESDALVPATVASIISYTVYSLTLPEQVRFLPLFGDQLDFSLSSPLELLPLAALAVALVLVGIVFIKTLYGIHGAFKRLPVPPVLRPAIGAAAAGGLGLALLRFTGDAQSLAVLSSGYGLIQAALEPEAMVGVALLLTVAFGKIITTGLTIGSGGSGGVFGPSMVIGATVGAAAGQTYHSLWPALVPEPRAYVIVGMAGFFAGCAHAPISTLVMVSEITGSYQLLLPVMWVSAICFLLCRRWTLYEKQVPSRLDSPAHAGDFLVDILADCKVRDVVREDGAVPQQISESTTLDEIVHLLADTRQAYFPVIDGENRVIGIFSDRDVRGSIYEESIWPVTVARDVMVSEVLSVTLDDDLNTALRRCTQRNIDELPVLDADRRLVGMLRRKDALAFYNDRLAEMKRRASD